MLAQTDLSSIVFLDIETVSGKKNYSDLNPVMQEMWTIKSDSLQKRQDETLRKNADETYNEMSAIYSEFGKIVCISVGVFRKDKNGILKFHTKSYFGHDEKKLLEDFKVLLEKHYNNPKKHFICGHNIKEFDIPYICRRMVINGLALPDMLDFHGKKPWDLEYLLDTLNLWRFGDYKAYTSLKLLCAIFDIPTPKDDIDGSEVGKTYWEENDVDRIEQYCRKDVLATARVLIRMMNQDPMSFEHIEP
jgi:DNA polymerase elongation subunit (family B)